MKKGEYGDGAKYRREAGPRAEYHGGGPKNEKGAQYRGEAGPGAEYHSEVGPRSEGPQGRRARQYGQSRRCGSGMLR